MNLEDVELNKPKEGPMLVDLYERIVTDISDKHDSKFLVRYNTCDITDDMLMSLRKFIKAVHMDTFPKIKYLSVSVAHC